MAAVRHLGFLNVRILPTGPIGKANMRHRAKFRADRSNVCGDMAGFRFFKMAAVRHLGFVSRVFGQPMILLVFVTVQNVVGIEAVVSIICQF